ncbi:adenylate cyclase [Christiangramia fulva]|uniref:Adenylate cyclase n=1 Tax=Christiangramia fulva TaxID=2126553 RepID=A0A2R3Z356_9FLAO|nr:CYTH domain-containing protein [Christiangramia fulva]AVR44697.1 adenylate cyclase [Christiangramia fulva]
MNEIERKFLVKSDKFKEEAQKKISIQQAYLNTDPARTIRVRTTGDKAYLTIKGKSNKSGTSRFEWEKEIPLEEAKELLKICEPGKIVKERYLVSSGRHTFEVDVFLEALEGLIIAEVELQDENDEFEIPSWLGKEVTGDVNYYNSRLVEKAAQKG